MRAVQGNGLVEQLTGASAILDAVLGIAIRSDNGRVVLGELL